MQVPHNIPVVQFNNLFDEDPIGRSLFESWLGASLFKKVKAHFQKMGEAGAQATPYSDLADKHSPELCKFDSRGDRVDQVVYHSSYQKLRELSYGQGIVAYKYDQGQAEDFKQNRQLIGFGAAYYFAQTEMGLFCPICMTDALARVLEVHGQGPQAKEALRRLTTQNLEELWEGAMFLTERQGGSDVGANQVQAIKREGCWFLEGHKWFCSNVDAKAILTLARMPGAEGAPDQGTRGLGLFLVLRDDPKDNWKNWEVHRLKDKLGVRAMASGEVTFSGTEAYLIGGANQGFKQMADMVNMSRLYNSVSSIAIARRGVLEALRYARQRRAFTKAVVELPLWRASMADLVAEQWGLFLLIFECVSSLDRLDQGQAGAQSLSRFLTPLCKAVSGHFAVFASSEAMEAIGGNAYIEEHIMPRLLRDAQVLPIWEGTTNIQSLDTLRVLKKEGPEGFINRVQELLNLASASPHHESLVKRFKNWQRALDDFSQLKPESQQRGAKFLLEDSARLMTLALMAKETTGPQSKLMEACLQRLMLRPAATSPLAMESWTLEETEEVILASV